MDENEFLAERFQADRPRLRAVAHRMLGSHSEAEDAVQEVWIKLARTDTSDVADMGGWLTTVVARTCLNQLQSRRARREVELDAEEPLVAVADPEYEAELADSVGLALLVVLDTLTPAERLAFVLHDVFAIPFKEIATIVDRTPETARQPASRARRRVQASTSPPETVAAQHRRVVDAFLSASRGGDFEALLNLLAADVVVSGDRIAVRAGAPERAAGARTVAELFSGRARAAEPALFDGAPGAVWAPDGEPRLLFEFTLVDARITGIHLVADPDRIAEVDVVIPGRP